MKKPIPLCEICQKPLEGKNYKGRSSYPRTCSTECKRLLISKERTKVDLLTGKKKSELSAIKAAETMRNEMINGKSKLQLRAEKASHTMRENGTRKIASEKRLKTMEENGEFLVIGDKIRNGMNKINEEGLTRAQIGARNAKEKMRETFEKSGRWIRQDEIKDFEIYLREVRSLTEKQPLHLLPNFDLRGHVSEDGFHLDHKFSIYDGFKHCVPVEKIASIKNLQFIYWKENVKKNHKSSISLEEVMSF